jgi:cobalt-precorrin 5A hydrolase
MDESRLVIITLSQRGYETALRIKEGLSVGAEIFVSARLRIGGEGVNEFSGGLLALTGELFDRYRGLVFVLPAGAAVRAVAPHINSKKTDPAVVVVDNVGRYVVSLLSGHEGGANGLAQDIANALRTDAVITTAAEAEKEIIVGVGCRRGVSGGAVAEAVRSALSDLGLRPGDVRLMATVDLKADERGIHDASEEMGIPLKIVSSEEIRHCIKDYAESAFVQEKVDLGGVCEPAALLAGRKAILIAGKKRYSGVTVAVARECFTW